jgi:hypothetical protein
MVVLGFSILNYAFYYLLSFFFFVSHHDGTKCGSIGHATSLLFTINLLPLTPTPTSKNIVSFCSKYKKLINSSYPG